MPKIKKFLTQKDLASKYKKLGLGGSFHTISNSALDKEISKDSYFGTDFKIDLESGGTFTQPDPRLVVRKQTKGEVKSNKDILMSYKTWSFEKEREYVFSKYQIFHKLIGNFSFFSAPIRLYSLVNNNFFNKFKIKNIKVNNNFPFVRLSFPKHASNSSALTIQRPNNRTIKLIPFIENKYTKKDENKNYLEWNKNFLNTESNQTRNRFPSINNNSFSGFYIPYPSTVEIQQFNRFNLPVKIACEENSYIEGGLLVISTGNNQNQKICYVSPHDIETGLANTIENFRVIKQVSSFALKKEQRHDLLEISKNSSNNLFPSYLTGIYNEIPILNKYGKKTFAKYTNVTGENSDTNFLLSWSPGNQESGLVPSNLRGEWIISSGRLGFFNGKNGTEKTQQDLESFGEGGFLKFITNETIYSSGPEITTEIYPENSINWSRLSDNLNVGSLNFSLIKAEDAARQKLTLSGFVEEPSVFQVRSFFLDSHNTNSGKLPFGIGKFTQTGVFNILDASGILTTFSGDNNFNYTLNPGSHLKQDTPLRDTYFYKFYNKLYSNPSHKQISTGTWDGVIPENTNFSIEIISTKLNKKVGLNKDLYIVYSGYGSGDEIDLISQKYINSKHLSENFKNIKFDERNSALTYTSYSTSDSKSNNSEILARKASAKKIQSYIYRALKTYLPEAISINKKFRKFYEFLDSLNIIYPASSDADKFSKIPEIIQTQNILPPINSSSSSSLPLPIPIPLPSSSSSSSSSSEPLVPGLL
jgi:hypothetical protein